MDHFINLYLVSRRALGSIKSAARPPALPVALDRHCENPVKNRPKSNDFVSTFPFFFLPAYY
jgi:hypothetical protein